MYRKKIFATVLAINFVIVGSGIIFEPGTLDAADHANTNVTLTVTSEISVTCDSSAALSGGAITAMTGGAATGSYSCTVTTPDTTGYSMTVVENHKLRIDTGGTGKEFTDYGATVTPTWTSPTSGNTKFGFCVDGDTVAPAKAYKYKSGTSLCDDDTGSADGLHCWSGFPTGTPTKIVSSGAASNSSGDAVKVDMQAEAASNNFLTPSDAYTNTITNTVAVGS